MKYLSFTIFNYRAIEGPLKIDLSKNHLIPIIGINECGKTTILRALFSFDCFNDGLNVNTKHLEDTKNLYRAGATAVPKIKAEVEISWEEFSRALSGLPNEPNYESIKRAYKRKKSGYSGTLSITRNLLDKCYNFESSIFDDTDANNQISKIIIRSLPYILFFDDFRDSFPDYIEIKQSDSDDPKGWAAIVERMFEITDENFSIFNLENVEDRERKSILAKVTKKLNGTLTKEWQNFKLDNNDALKIKIDYEPPVSNGAMKENAKLKFDIVETDENGEEHYFYIRDRSKGFFWFFNFVMKLEFNPKVISNAGVDAIYLLDEPGSYLHAAAQAKLCSKIRDLSKKNAVIYCTHSHYLLNPDVIPISSIKIAEKSASNNINLLSIFEYEGELKDKKSAFQPVYDALSIKPFKLDLGSSSRAVITEGIYDYYCFDMFLGNHDIHFIPAQNADSVLYYISLMIGWAIPFNALWDNDTSGRMAKEKCSKQLGDKISKRTHLLPIHGKQKIRILQNLFEGNDLIMIKNTLGLPPNTNFEKVVSAFYYSPLRANVFDAISQKTKTNFEEVFNLFSFN